MAQERRFCTNCGVPLIPGTKFCGSCGNQVGASIVSPVTPPEQVSLPPVPTTAGGEILIGIIPNVKRKKGLFTIEVFNIVVTSQRMIFASLTTNMIKDAAKDARSQGFLSGLVGSFTAGLNYYKKYYNISPGTILEENPQNFFVEMSRIKKVKLDIGRLRSEPDDMNNKYDDSRLEIQTIGEKLLFALPNSYHEEAHAVIRKAGLL
jgi:hypothetical protein